MTAFTRRPRPRPPQRYLARLAWIACAVLLIGCGDDADGASTTTAPPSTDGSSTTRRTTTTTTTDATVTSTSGPPPSSGTAATPEEQEIIDRYVGYWAARTSANTGTPNPADPALAEHATGQQLDAVIAETQANLDGGLAFRSAAQPANFRRVRVVSIDGDTAVVQECVVDDGLVVRRDSGQVVDDSVTTQSVRGELRRVEGLWRLAGTSVVQSWEGVAGCAVGG